ncbi:MAG: TRM11 family SAM-dependent methyltransferase, partial [Candidatus Thorarchaeota archaeon]
EHTLLQADSRKLPIKGINSIITDPPYGRASSTRGAIAKQLINSTLSQSLEILEPNGTLCICGSTDLDISSILDEIGITKLHHIEVPVHRGLTRDIISARI